LPSYATAPVAKLPQVLEFDDHLLNRRDAFIITASATKRVNSKWSYRIVCAEHNHLPSFDPSAHNMHRRRTLAQQQQERDLTKRRAFPAREMSEIIRDFSAAAAEPMFSRQSDI
jgi:hypothetical protein